MAVSDLNGDGKLDVAFSGEELPNFQVAILLGSRTDGHRHGSEVYSVPNELRVAESRHP
jgi:hypothetical protein